MPGTGKTTVASIFAKLLSASGSRAGHNFLSLTAHDALRMGPAEFSRQLSTLTGNKVLEESDVEPVLDALRTTLVTKNVASEVAGELCAAVGRGLTGTRVAAAGSVGATVTRALRDDINRILSPRRPMDILADVRAKKAAGGGVSARAVERRRRYGG